MNEAKRQTYVLRLWRGSEEDECWKGALVDVSAGDTRHFRSLAELYAALCVQLTAAGRQVVGDEERSDV